jgi:HKD family nuclease
MLHIQDPFFSNSYTLHEALIKSCSTSIEGYGAYAFASKSGIEILLKDQEFDSLLQRGNFSLIVGIDEITNIASLDALNNVVLSRPNLIVHAFDHYNKGSLFHPKLSYFKNEDDTGTLIVGSGNLTLGGLRKNREAFTVLNLNTEEFQRIDLYWKSWIKQSNTYLKEISDPFVISKAAENIYLRRTKSFPQEKNENTEVSFVVNDDVELHEDGWQFYADNKVLIAEIPRSGDRWKQANFDLNTFQTFFGATIGDKNQRILIRNINEDFSLSSIEIRPSVSVISQNYRIELDAASGLDYPKKGKPIGIFIQLTTRMFLYHIFMPDHLIYNEILDWLKQNWKGREDRMKRIVTISTEINKIITQSVFDKYLIKI